jgi:hypothetical protein
MLTNTENTSGDLVQVSPAGNDFELRIKGNLSICLFCLLICLGI